MSLKEIINELVRITGETQYNALFTLVKMQPEYIFKAENIFFQLNNDSSLCIILEPDSWILLEILNTIGGVKVKYLGHDLDSDIENHDQIRELFISIWNNSLLQ